MDSGFAISATTAAADRAPRFHADEPRPASGEYAARKAREADRLWPAPLPAAELMPDWLTGYEQTPGLRAAWLAQRGDRTAGMWGGGQNAGAAHHGPVRASNGDSSTNANAAGAPNQAALMEM